MKTTKEQIEMAISFTREQYEEKRSLSSNENVDFDEFIYNVIESETSFEEMIDMAEFAFKNM